MLGLKRGEVFLCPHDADWEIQARETARKLKLILGDTAVDIQHVGSTAVQTIKAKPIIDIAVAATGLDDVMALKNKLEESGFYYRPGAGQPGQLLFACGSLYDGSGDLQTHFIHIVPAGSARWKNYIAFRDCLNDTPVLAKEYENLKIHLAENLPADGGRQEYTAAKAEFISRVIKMSDKSYKKTEGL